MSYPPRRPVSRRGKVSQDPAIAVCCSGDGTNLQAIIRAVRQRRLKARIALVVCDNAQAYALVRAQRAGIPVTVMDARRFKSRAAFDRSLSRILKAAKIKLVVLAGFMRILSPGFVRQFKNRILNIHPALLPSFKGTYGIRDALDYGVKVTGVTVHFVDEKLDNGPILAQEVIQIKPGESEAALAKRIHHVEHRLYPAVIQKVLSKKIYAGGRVVK